MLKLIKIIYKYNLLLIYEFLFMKKKNFFLKIKK